VTSADNQQETLPSPARTSVYPCKQQYTRGRMERLKRILNDHTRDAKGSILHDRQLW